MAILDGEAMQVIILLAQGLWGVVLWQFAAINTRLARIEQSLQAQQVEIVRDYATQEDHDSLRNRVHALAGNVQALKVYDHLRQNGFMAEDKG